MYFLKFSDILMETPIFDQMSYQKIETLIQLLNEDKIIAFPTETVYGLGALIRSKTAQNLLYRLKNRPLSKGFIVHLGKISDVTTVAEKIPDSFYLLAQEFFPGPLTIILNKKKSFEGLISSDSTVAVRMPDHSQTLQLLQALGQPIVGTSANLSGQKVITCPKEVFSQFHGKIGAIIDGGASSIGYPSTILSLVEKEPIIYREGKILAEDIENVLNRQVQNHCK